MSTSLKRLMLCGFMLSLVTRVAMAQWAPLPATSGTVVLMRRADGVMLSDSVVSITATNLLVERIERASGGALLARSGRVYLKSASGIQLMDSIGAQLVFPQPWRQSKSWSYARSGAYFRYAIVGDTTVWGLGKRYDAILVQLTVEKGDARSLVRYVVADGLGIVGRMTLPVSRNDDFQFYGERTAVVVVAERSSEAPSIDYRPASTSHASSATTERHFFLGVAPFAGGSGYRKPPSGYLRETKYYAGAMLETGVDGPIGVRARYGVLTEFLGGSATGRSRELILGELTFEHFSPSRSVGYFLSGGGAWSRAYKGTSDKFVSSGVATAGIRFNGRSRALGFDATYLAENVPVSIAPDPFSSVPYQVGVNPKSLGDAVLYSVFLRFF